MPHKNLQSHLPIKGEERDVADLRGTLPSLPPARELPKAEEETGKLSRVREALRIALEEAAQRRSRGRFEQIEPLTRGLPPGSLAGVSSLMRSGIQADVSGRFSDIISAIKEENEARGKELERIQELRLEFGSLVPSSITDLDTALDLIAPAVDKERKLRLAKLSQEQANDNDIESWAEDVAKGIRTMSQVPNAIKTQVQIRSQAIAKRLEKEASREFKDLILLRIETKQTDFEQERQLALFDQRFTAAEIRDFIDYIDGLEQTAKELKGPSKGFFSALKNFGILNEEQKERVRELKRVAPF